MSKKLEVSCPCCEKKFNYYESEFRPFCSQRCKDVDLGHWLTESYTVPGERVQNQDDEDFDLGEQEYE